MRSIVAWRTLLLPAVAWLALGPAGGSLAAVVQADPPSAVISHIDDSRIEESSGLAYSAKYPDLAYTMNDSHNRMVVYAIRVSTGKVVGLVDLDSLDLSDPESIAVDPQGRLWLGDLGDNDGNRDDASIVVFDEPGPRTAAPGNLQRFRVAYPDGAANVEAMMVYPTTKQVFLINKTDGGQGSLYALPQPLRAGEKNVAVNLHRPMPARASDATFTPDGRHALVKTATGVVGYDVQTWKVVASFETPGLDKGESITVEPGGRTILVGSEGSGSPIRRVTLPATLASVAATRPATGDTTSPTGSTSSASPLPPLPPVTPNVKPAGLTAPGWAAPAGLGVAVLAAAGWALQVARRRRRLAHRHQRIYERARH